MLPSTLTWTPLSTANWGGQGWAGGVSGNTAPVPSLRDQPSPTGQGSRLAALLRTREVRDEKGLFPPAVLQ